MLSGYTYTHKRLQTVPDTSSMTIRNKYCRKKKYSQEALLVVFRTTLETQMNGWRNAFCLFFPPVLSCSLRTSSCSLTRSLTVSSSPSLPPSHSFTRSLARSHTLSSHLHLPLFYVPLIHKPILASHHSSSSSLVSAIKRWSLEGGQGYITYYT